MNIAVTGSNGQLGTDIVNVLTERKHNVKGFTHNDIEIADYESTLAVLKDFNPDVVINTAAMHNVEACEERPCDSFTVNGIGSKNLALAVNELDAKLIHISTDYVFDGAKGAPYEETDLPLPLNVYGNTKLSGEHFIEAIAKKYMILRVSGIYGSSPCRAKGGNNFAQLMLKLAKERGKVRVVDDEFLTPTYTLEIAEQTAKILDSVCRNGVYHLTAEGSCSWYEFAKAVFEISDTEVVLEKAEPGEFAVKVNRPKYSVLENRALKEEGINIMSHWKDGLKRYLESL